MSEITVSVVGSTTINPTVGNGDTVSVTIASTGERGPSGSTGPAGPANSLTIGTVTQGTAAATITGTAPNQVLNLVLQKGDAGTPATNIELQSNGTYLQWRLVGSSSWTNLVALSAITGPTGSTGAAGTPVELQATSTYIQWRYVGGLTWTNVIALSSLVGATGATGPQGPAGPPINLADETPQPLGTASAGTAQTAARADHVHAVGSITYSSLSGIPSTFAPSAHQHVVSDVTGLQSALDGKQAAGSYATLVGGTVPSSQLPSYVDDVREAASLSAFPTTGDVGVIYVAVDSKKIYRWSGSAYVEISASPGSTDSVTEGSTNLYFTSARAVAAIPAATSSVAGLVKVGSNLLITDGVLSATGGSSWSSVPASATATGTAGQISYDSSGNFYLCIASNTWVRTSLATWGGSTPTITISSQPSNQTASSGAATFSVTASVTSGTLTYQWQRSTDSGLTWSAVSGATSSSLSLASQTSTNNGNQYRVVISSTGASSVTSNAATLTVGSSYTPTAVLLTSGTSYTVPSGASTMKAWAIGGGGGDNASYGFPAGGCAYKTWSVSGGASVTYAIGESGRTLIGGHNGDGGTSTVTYGGVTISGYGGGGSSRTGGSFAGGDGGAAGGNSVNFFGSSVRGGAVGGNEAALVSCGRRPATDISGLFAAVALAGGKSIEDCGGAPAFGSGGWADKYATAKVPGYGGGGGRNGTAFVASWPGAVVLYFT
jgi:hypothetical protein